ncbi:MAG: hypothetical protein ABIO94_03510 [Opitutaceae bacterium]
MKAFPALRALACASILSIVGVTKSSAQLFFHVVDVTAGNVVSGSNLGVAIDATFEFNYSGLGSLRLTLTNRAGTAKNAGEGGGFYTTGILTSFGFDLPGSFATPDVPVVTYTPGPGSFTQTSLVDPINFAVVQPYSETNPVGTFDIGAEASSPAPDNGLAAGATAVFTFQFGGDLTNFSQANFFGSNGSDSDFGFRFQAVGTNGSGSDKFVYYDNPPIPEPSTYGLVAASALIGLVGVKRYRSRKSVAAA